MSLTRCVLCVGMLPVGKWLGTAIFFMTVSCRRGRWGWGRVCLLPVQDVLRFLGGDLELFGVRAEMKDAWREVFSQGGDDTAGYTFPTCNPVKRIDMLMLRGRLEAQSFRLVGRSPIAETKHWPGRGMLDVYPYQSPIWASDHLGVLVNVSIINDDWAESLP